MMQEDVPAAFDKPLEGLETYATVGDFDNGGGVLVERKSAVYSSGEWVKYYDAEYAVDYYHNYR